MNFDAGSANVRVVHEAIIFYAAAVGILSVWAALSARHWFARGAVVAIAIAVLIPIGAYEPAILFLISTPPIVITLAVIRRWSRIGSAAESSTEVQRFIGSRVLTPSYAVIAVYLLLAYFGPTLYAFGPIAARPSWYEWLAFGSLVVAPGAVMIVLFRREAPANPPVTTRSDYGRNPIRFRFGMLDTLLALVIVGIVSATLASILRTPLVLDWLGILGSAACLWMISVTAAGFVLLPRGWMALAVAVGLAVVASAALHTWVLQDWVGIDPWLWIDNWLPRFKRFLFAFSLLAITTTVAMYLLLVGGAFCKSADRIPSSDLVLKSARIALVCLCTALYGPLAVVYCNMVAKPTIPNDSPAVPNGYPRILAIARELNRLNPQGSTTDVIRKSQSDPAKAENVRQAYRDLSAAFEIPASVPVDLKRDVWASYYDEQVTIIQMFRSVARSLQTEGNALQAAQKYDEAAELGLINVRLGATLQRGGLLVNSLVGIAIEGVGVDQISGNRRHLSPKALESLIPSLQAIDKDREVAQTTIARDIAWSDLAYSWRSTLPREAPAVLVPTHPTESSGTASAFESAIARRDSLQRLLMTELAIRAFQGAESRLPEALSDLCPRYLSSVPVDPYSGANLIYRRLGDTHVLYSVGNDRQDNGGRFGTITDFYGSGGFDLDVDILQRSDLPRPVGTGQ